MEDVERLYYVQHKKREGNLFLESNKNLEKVKQFLTHKGFNYSKVVEIRDKDKYMYEAIPITEAML